MKSPLKELRKELVVLKRRTQLVENAIRIHEALEAPVPVDAEALTRAGKGGSLSALTYPEAIRAILNQAKRRPLRIPVILERLKKGGRPVTTTGPYRTVYRCMRDHAAMFHNNNGEWSLKKAEVAVEWPDGELPSQTRPDGRAWEDDSET